MRIKVPYFSHSSCEFLVTVFFCTNSRPLQGKRYTLHYTNKISYCNTTLSKYNLLIVFCIHCCCIALLKPLSPLYLLYSCEVVNLHDIRVVGLTAMFIQGQLMSTTPRHFYIFHRLANYSTGIQKAQKSLERVEIPMLTHLVSIVVRLNNTGTYDM